MFVSVRSPELDIGGEQIALSGTCVLLSWAVQDASAARQYVEQKSHHDSHDMKDSYPVPSAVAVKCICGWLRPAFDTLSRDMNLPRRTKEQIFGGCLNAPRR